MSKNYSPPNKMGSGYVKGECGHAVKVLEDGYECAECIVLALRDYEDFIKAFIQDWESDPVYIDQVYYNRGKELLDIYGKAKTNENN